MLKGTMMKQKLGAVVFFLGLMVLMGIGGVVTDMPAEATVVDWVNLFGIGVTAACLAQAGLWMIKGEI
jgi:hypothetical protein